MPDDRTTSSGDSRVKDASAAFADFNMQSIKAALRRQTEMLDVLHDIGRDWFARATSEAELALKLPNKLSAAHTVPDALSAYNEWLNEWMTMCGEDGRRLIADSQRIMDTGASCFAAGGRGAAT